MSTTWRFAPDPVLFRHFIDDVRSLSGTVYGRRMYEVMRYWGRGSCRVGYGGTRLCGGVAEPAEMGRVAFAAIGRPERHTLQG